jgi:hypothetical protein
MEIKGLQSKALQCVNWMSYHQNIDANFVVYSHDQSTVVKEIKETTSKEIKNFLIKEIS